MLPSISSQFPFASCWRVHLPSWLPPTEKAVPKDMLLQLSSGSRPAFPARRPTLVLRIARGSAGCGSVENRRQRRGEVGSARLHLALVLVGEREKNALGR